MRIPVLWSLLFLANLFSFSLYGNVISVSSLSDSGSGSLREAVSNSMAGDTIDFMVSGEIRLDSQIVIDTHLVILGPGAGMLGIDGQEKDRLFQIGKEDTVYIEGLSLHHGLTDTKTAPSGGAIFNEGYLSLHQCYVHHNRARYGGAINNGNFEIDSRLFLTECTFAWNRAYSDTIESSGAPRAGGAIYQEGRFGSSRVEASNCTFSHNEAQQSGGAVFMIGDENVQVSFQAFNCTFAENMSPDVGAIDILQFAVLRLRSSIMANNHGTIPNFQGTLSTFGHNLIDDDIGISYFPTPDSTDILNQDARMLDLGDNGGPLPTHPVSCTSPAIDAAHINSSPIADQRGILRTGLPDIGAFELDPEFDILVSNTASSGRGSFPQSVFLACPGDSIIMNDISGIVRLKEEMILDKDLFIQGNTVAPLILSGEDSLRIFQITSGTEVEISWLSFKSGKPELYGGGAIQNKGKLSLAWCCLRQNQAVSGGAIANYGDGDTAWLDMSNCTISANRSNTLDGGGIDNRAITHPAFANLLHCTIANNSAANKGGGIFNSTGSEFTLRNCLTSDNQADKGDDGYGNIKSEGHNLWGDDAEVVHQGNGAGDLLNANASLSPLGPHGGPTFTHRLESGSQAIDAGDSNNIPATDQRGQARIFNLIADIGAYEYDPATSLNEFPDSHFLPPYPNPFRETLMVPLQAPSGQNITLQLRDLTGRLLISMDITSNGSNSAYSLDLQEEMPEGIYFLIVKNGNQTFSHKVIRKK